MMHQFSDSELEAIAAIGMSVMDYLIIRGEHGTVLGLRLNHSAYVMAMHRCKSRDALELGDDMNAIREYLGKQLCQIAKRKIARMIRRGELEKPI